MAAGNHDLGEGEIPLEVVQEQVVVEDNPEEWQYKYIRENILKITNFINLKIKEVSINSVIYSVRLLPDLIACFLICFDNSEVIFMLN